MNTEVKLLDCDALVKNHRQIVEEELSRLYDGVPWTNVVDEENVKAYIAHRLAELEMPRFYTDAQ